jgi:hypothetical protein
VRAGAFDVVVMLGAGEVIVMVVVTGSLHPNQPHFSQEVVVNVVVKVVVGDEAVVVGSSRQPHQPGVSQVVERVDHVAVVVVVVVLVPVPVPVPVPVLSFP